MAGKQHPPVLVHIGNKNCRICFEGVKHTVTVVGINVHVSHSFQAVMTAQQFSRYTAVIKNAEPGSLIAKCMMQPANRDKAPFRRSRHDGLDQIQGATDIS